MNETKEFNRFGNLKVEEKAIREQLKTEYGKQANGQDYSNLLNDLFEDYERLLDVYNNYVYEFGMDDELERANTELMSEDFINGSEKRWIDSTVETIRNSALNPFLKAIVLNVFGE